MVIGLVDDELENKELIVRLESGDEVIVSKPKYMKDDGVFIYHNDENKYKVIEYDPIRIFVSFTNGSFRLLFNKFILNDKNRNKVLLV